MTMIAYGLIRMNDLKLVPKPPVIEHGKPQPRPKLSKSHVIDFNASVLIEEEPDKVAASRIYRKPCSALHHSKRSPNSKFKLALALASRAMVGRICVIVIGKAPRTNCPTFIVEDNDWLLCVTCTPLPAYMRL